MKSGFRQRGGFWVLTQFALMIAILVVAPLRGGDWDGWWSPVAAAVLLVAGAVLGIGGAISLGGNRTAFPEPLPHARLVRTGVYKIVRHPLYSSVILLSFAWALGWRSLPALALALATLVLLDAKARHEERRLRAKFAGYDRYAREVKRLVPWIY